jgi:hypothetical protein
VKPLYLLVCATVNTDSHPAIAAYSAGHVSPNPPLPAKLTPLHFDHQGGLMEQSYASLQRGRQG